MKKFYEFFVEVLDDFLLDGFLMIRELLVCDVCNIFGFMVFLKFGEERIVWGYVMYV